MLSVSVMLSVTDTGFVVVSVPSSVLGPGYGFVLSPNTDVNL